MGISSTANYIFEKYNKKRKEEKKDRVLDFFLMKNEPIYFRIAFWIFTCSMISFVVAAIILNIWVMVISLAIAFFILILMVIINPNYRKIEKIETRDYSIIKKLLINKRMYSINSMDALIKETENYLENYRKSGDGMKRFIKSSLLVIQFYVPIFISLLSFEQNQIELNIQDNLVTILYFILFSIMLRFILESIDIFEFNFTKTKKIELFIEYLYQIRTDLTIELENNKYNNLDYNYYINQVY